MHENHTTMVIFFQNFAWTMKMSVWKVASYQFNLGSIIKGLHGLQIDDEMNLVDKASKF